MSALDGKAHCRKHYNRGQSAVLGEHRTKLQIRVETDDGLSVYQIDGCVFPRHDEPMKCDYLALQNSRGLEVYIELKTGLSPKTLEKAIRQIVETIRALGLADANRRWFVIKGRSGVAQTKAQKVVRQSKSLLSRYRAKLLFPASQDALEVGNDVKKLKGGT